MAQQQMKTWNVRVHRNGGSQQLGQVREATEERHLLCSRCGH